MAKGDFLNQIKNVNSKLALWQKTLIIGSVLGVLVGLGFLLVKGSNNKSYAVLYTQMDNAEAGKIVEKLKDKKIDYQLSDNGSTILVDKEKVYDTRISLASEGLPETGTVGFELFDKANLGMSEFVQKLNYRRALEGELSRTIQSLDPVKKARVHIVVPEKALFEKDQKRPTASVTLHMKNERSLQRVDIEGIQKMVASSIEGLSASDVNIVDNRGKVLSVLQNDKGTAAGITENQIESQLKFEQYLSNKVQSLLDGVLGVGNSEVRVNAELDFTQRAETTTEFNPETQVARSEQSTTDQFKTTDPNTLPTDGTSTPLPTNDKQTSNTVINYEINKTEKKIVDEVGKVKRLTIAVLVNGNHKIMHNNKVKSLQNVPTISDDMNKLTDIVKNAVGYDLTRNDQVSVVMVPFDFNEVDTPAAELVPIPWYQQPENIKLFVLIGALVVVMFIIYRILNSRPVRERMRIAFNLPEKAVIEEEDVNLDQLNDDKLDRLIFDAEDMLLLPAELPDQLLLEGEKSYRQMEDFGSEDEFDSRSLADRASMTEDRLVGQMSEDSIMKMELKTKIQDYMDDSTMDAVRLIRMFLSQDVEERMQKFNQAAMN